MKRYGFVTLVLMFALFLAWQSARAADLKLQIKKKPQLSAEPSSGPLQQTIKLPSAVRMQVMKKKLSLPVDSENLQNQFNEINSMARNYEVGVGTMLKHQKHCAELSYSVQEQAAAECGETEPLKQCMEKLIQHCIADLSTPGASIGVPEVDVLGTKVGGGTSSTSSLSVESFREAAIETAALAKALSQQLSQYASQAERNANAWRENLDP